MYVKTSSLFLDQGRCLARKESNLSSEGSPNLGPQGTSWLKAGSQGSDLEGGDGASGE